MVDVKHINTTKPQLEIDFGELVDENPDSIIGYFIANHKVVSEKKREKMLEVILQVIENHNDICYVNRITDDFIELIPADPKVGPVPFKIFMTTTTEKPEGTGTKPESDLFLKDLFISIQKSTGDVFRISSMEDYLHYSGKGMFPVPLDHGDVPEEERQYFSVEDFKAKKDDILKISKSLPFTNNAIEKVVSK